MGAELCAGKVEGRARIVGRPFDDGARRGCRSSIRELARSRQFTCAIRPSHGKLRFVQPVLGPPATKGHVSVARLTRHWYVACQSHELGQQPLRRVLLGTPFVLFRDAEGKPAALLDRCPHRNVPLSLGRVNARGHLECAYHGWQFDSGGRCRAVPGLVEVGGPKERSCPHAAVRERDGLVWVYPALDEVPSSEPFDLQLSRFRDYAWVRQEVRSEATLHATLENALDVPHTAFLHRGLFRGGERHPVRVRVRRTASQVEAEYMGEPRPSGVVGRLLSPTGGMVEHWDRFILPSIAQVEYRLGLESHFLITAFCTPESDFSTRLTALAGFKTPLPARVIAPLLKPVALWIFRQDARILRAQSENVRLFGGERFESTELDFLGPHIWRLLKQAERGEAGEVTTEREVTFFA